mmetsp:Transcript_43390/g.117613  ORF Transcript_43390/g.117613 Transcript_43390/m.117613 type:complete len:271 (+) Transcript_43390:2758-3570(+)
MPGALTTSPSTPAAIESESLPPSMPTPVASMPSRSATHASHMRAPSPASLAAHIQLPEALMSVRAERGAHTRLVRHSATTIRAMAAGSRRPLIGCSPHALAMPVVPKCDWAMTAQFASGICNGPTHCCCATRPVTERSTLCTRKRLEPTDRRRRTRSSASGTVRPSGSTRGAHGCCGRSLLKTLGGRSARTMSSGRSTGVVPLEESRTTTRPVEVTVPTTQYGQFSRAQIASNISRLDSSRRRALFSWYSAPQISMTDMVGSPRRTLRMS